MLFDSPLKAWLNDFLDIVFEGKSARTAPGGKAVLSS
jgi:GMP synthase (glutamine-hydrolysing)